MPGTAGGLTQGDEVAADAFEAALEAKGIEGGGSSGTLSVAASIVEADKPESAAAGSSEREAVTTSEDEADEPLHDDPEIAALLKKHDGDVNKALREAAEAQKLIGKQGQELGELRAVREQVAELRGRIEQQAAQTPTVAPTILSETQIDELADQHGFWEVAKWAANNSPGSVDAILAKWQEIEPVFATRFDRQYQEWLAQQASAKTGSAKDETAEYVANRKAEEALSDAMASVAGDFTDYEDFKEYIPLALESVPKHVAAAIISTDPEVKAEGIKDLYERAQRLSAVEAGKAATKEAAEASAAGKQRARVIQGQSGVQPTPKAPAGEQESREAVVDAFKKSILGAETTSVRDGLTYAKS
jgi:hypothetical protein